MNQTLLKYKLVLLPSVLVMLLDFALLAINYYVTAQIEVSAKNINIAGRQRMLSQKIIKLASLIHNASQHQTVPLGDMDKLAKAVVCIRLMKYKMLLVKMLTLQRLQVMRDLAKHDE